MSLRALMVDVDGVVVRHPPGYRWDQRLQGDLGLDPMALQSAFFQVHWPDVALGRADLFDRLEPVLALTDYWFGHDAALDQVLLADLAAEAARGVALHLATVQEHHRARHLMEALGLSGLFGAIHYSADYGLAKPDPAFFHAVCARTGLAPREVLLIDDSLANVEAARACGWRAQLWDGTRRLSEVLALSETAT